MTTNVIQFPVKIPAWTFGDRLRKARRESGLGQADFADALGVGRQAYAAWESDRNTPRDITGTAEVLERVTGFPRAWFLGWMDSPTNPDGGSSVDISSLSGSQVPPTSLYEGHALGIAA